MTEGGREKRERERERERERAERERGGGEKRGRWKSGHREIETRAHRENNDDSPFPSTFRHIDDVTTTPNQACTRGVRT